MTTPFPCGRARSWPPRRSSSHCSSAQRSRWRAGQDRPGGLREGARPHPGAPQGGRGQEQIAGGVALVARHGKVVSLTTVGMQDIEGIVPLTEATIFRIASMSKPITSVAVMVLVDDGKLTVTDPLSKFVPEFKDVKVLVPARDGKSFETVKAAREITIHDLLTHTSGISCRLLNKPFVARMCQGRAFRTAWWRRRARSATTCRLATAAGLPAGAAWECGLNTDVLGHVVELVSGQSLEQFCRERIFKPLKMNDTCFILPKEKRSRLSALYAVGADKTIARSATSR